MKNSKFIFCLFLFVFLFNFSVISFSKEAFVTDQKSAVEAIMNRDVETIRLPGGRQLHVTFFIPNLSRNLKFTSEADNPARLRPVQNHMNFFVVNSDKDFENATLTFENFMLDIDRDLFSHGQFNFATRTGKMIFNNIKVKNVSHKSSTRFIISYGPGLELNNMDFENVSHPIEIRYIGNNDFSFKNSKIFNGNAVFNSNASTGKYYFENIDIKGTFDYPVFSFNSILDKNSEVHFDSKTIDGFYSNSTGVFLAAFHPEIPLSDKQRTVFYKESYNSFIKKYEDLTFNVFIDPSYIEKLTPTFNNPSDFENTVKILLSELDSTKLNHLKVRKLLGLYYLTSVYPVLNILELDNPREVRKIFNYHQKIDAVFSEMPEYTTFAKILTNGLLDYSPESPFILNIFNYNFFIDNKNIKEMALEFDYSKFDRLIENIENVNSISDSLSLSILNKIEKEMWDDIVYEFRNDTNFISQTKKTLEDIKKLKSENKIITNFLGYELPLIFTYSIIYGQVLSTDDEAVIKEAAKRFMQYDWIYKEKSTLTDTTALRNAVGRRIQRTIKK
ncbi:MAG: hypothetical protein WC002_08195 [Candidatus Muiribacteriota bacterium]